MRLPLKVASAIRARTLIPAKARVLVALSGGADSVALLHCLIELSKKRDLRYSIHAAHLNHQLRGQAARNDASFCRRLCKRLGIEMLEAACDTPNLVKTLKRSEEEVARIVRRSFLARACRIKACSCIAVAHHADDRIETIIYRLCRGTGLAGLEGIGWTGPLDLKNEPDVRAYIQWKENGKPIDEPACSKKAPDPDGVIRPLLGIRREEIIEYLKSKRQKFCTDETNFDTRIPRNAVRQIVLPVLENQVHPGTRAALWRLGEEAELHADRRAWRRGWLEGIAALHTEGHLILPVPKTGGPPTIEELQDIMSLLKTVWKNAKLVISIKHLQQVRDLFGTSGVARHIQLPGKVLVERKSKAKEVCISRIRK